MKRSATKAEPITPAQYRAFQEAYDFFNAELFAGSLPHVLVTLQRHAKALGYFSPDRFTARTEKAAALESVFHDLPHEPNPVYSRKKLSDFRMTHFVVARDLLIVELTEPELRQVKVRGRGESLHELEIIHSPPVAYPQTRAWAQHFHRSLTSAHGLAWRPRLGGEGMSYVFFGDRLSLTDFTSVGAAVPIDSGAGRETIERIAGSTYIRLISS